MKNNEAGRCPGCGKHCPMGNARCKYGVKYFAKQAVNEPEKRTHKWEKHVERGGLAWRLLTAGRMIKKALKSKKLTEAQLTGRLTDEEKLQLAGILDKLGTLQGE